MKVRYTDNSKYVTVYCTNALRENALKLITSILKASTAKWKGVEFPDGIIPETATFIALIPVPMASKCWDEVEKKLKNRDLQLPVEGLFASLPKTDGAEIDENGRIKHPVIIPGEEKNGVEFVDKISEYAMDAWERLAEWPDARDSILRTLMVHGARVKPSSDSSSIVKKERGEGCLVETCQKI